MRLMDELGVTVPAGLAEQFAVEGKTPLFFAKNGELAGTIAVADEVKETSAGAIAALRSLGVDVRMLTGDNRVTAEAIARRVGLSSEQVIADVIKLFVTGGVFDATEVGEPGVLRMPVEVARGGVQGCARGESAGYGPCREYRGREGRALRPALTRLSTALR